MMKQTLISAFVFVMLQACGDISCTKPCDPSIPSPDPGSCADHTKDPGTLGGPCIDAALGDHCEGDGLACISGACIPCGSPGEACCGEYSTNGNCSGGGTCTANSDEFRECDGSCGQVGQPCCGESQNVCDNASGATCDPSTRECVAQEQSCTFSVTDPVQKIPVVDGAELRSRPRDAVRGVVDLGVVPDILEDYLVPGVDDLVVKRVYARKFVTASREKRPASLRAFLAAEHVLVSPRGEGGGYVDEMLEKLGQQRRVAVTVPGFIAALELVKQTDLISTLPDDVVRVLGGRLHVQKCPVETPTLYMSVLWASRFTQDGRHAWLHGVVTDAVRSLGPR